MKRGFTYQRWGKGVLLVLVISISFAALLLFQSKEGQVTKLINKQSSVQTYQAVQQGQPIFNLQPNEGGLSLRDVTIHEVFLEKNGVERLLARVGIRLRQQYPYQNKNTDIFVPSNPEGPDIFTSNTPEGTDMPVIGAVLKLPKEYLGDNYKGALQQAMGDPIVGKDAITKEFKKRNAENLLVKGGYPFVAICMKEDELDKCWFK